MILIQIILLLLATIAIVLLINAENIVNKIAKGENIMKFSNSVYNVLKYICQIALPAIGGLYFALAQIWQLPYAEQVVGTISAVTACLGILLGISTYSYNKES